jgi:hypothetical protein
MQLTRMDAHLLLSHFLTLSLIFAPSLRRCRWSDAAGVTKERGRGTVLSYEL